jgi:hypothetical protein
MRKYELMQELKACKARLLEIKEWINCVQLKPYDKKSKALKNQMLRSVTEAIREIDGKLK